MELSATRESLSDRGSGLTHTPQGQAKIVRCALAMRNHGGGFMLIGFDNATGDPVANDHPADVRVSFHIDRIQGRITRLASESFKANVHFVERDGALFPVIEIRRASENPRCIKVIAGRFCGATVDRENRVHVRTLDANNTPSSSEAICKDWNRRLETCFDNREADIGPFLRSRHLSGSAPSFENSRPTCRTQATHHESDEEGAAASAGSGPWADSARSYRTRANNIWNCRTRQLGDRGDNQRRKRPLASPNLQFLTPLSSNPTTLGWPVWLHRETCDQTARPDLERTKRWEGIHRKVRVGIVLLILAFCVSPQPSEFYLYRALQDDVPVRDRGPAPMTEFDFGLPVIRSAEAVGVALAYAKALGTSGSEAARPARAFGGPDCRAVSSVPGHSRSDTFRRDDTLIGTKYFQMSWFRWTPQHLAFTSLCT